MIRTENHIGDDTATYSPPRGETTGNGSGILGLTSSYVMVSRAGTAGGTDDLIVVTITGYHYTLITFAIAGSHPGQDIIADAQVEH